MKEPYIIFSKGVTDLWVHEAQDPDGDWGPTGDYVKSKTGQEIVSLDILPDKLGAQTIQLIYSEFEPDLKTRIVRYARAEVI